MNRWFCLLAGFAVAIAFASCDSGTTPSRPLTVNQLKAERLRMVAEIGRPAPGTMSFRVGVENRTAAETTLRFTDGQFFDIEVADRGGDLVWRWSHDKAFTQALWDLELKAGESYARDADWDLIGNDGKPLSPGSYTARFVITSSPRDASLVLELPLTI